MKGTKRGRPSPAIVVAVVALVAALAGTAVAGPGDDGGINKSLVKKLAKKKANQQIKKATPWDAADLGVDSVHAEELAGILTHGQSATVPPTGFAGTEIVANCLAGEKLISGGVRAPTGDILMGEEHQQGQGWRAEVHNFGPNPEVVQVEAYCLDS
jgi:hypothetical protein